MIDPATYSTPLSSDSPSGPNLEYDPDFLALERAQAGKPEQTIGDAVKPAEEPDWPDVVERATALLERTRDLRVAVTLTTALLRTEGFPGFAAGMTLISTLLDQQWATVHPQLDAEDDDDPTSRINSLLSLAAPDGILKILREVPLVVSPLLGRFSLRDVRIASNKLAPPASMTNPPKQVEVDAAFREAHPEKLQITLSAVTSAADSVSAIDRLLVDKVGARAPELKPLAVDLAEIKGLLGDKTGVVAGSKPVADDASSLGLAAVQRIAGTVSEIGSREDVVRQIDRICEYYKRYEPSSPLPLLLQRAKRLVTKDFLEIIRDLTPGGVAEAELLGGVEKSAE